MQKLYFLHNHIPPSDPPLATPLPNCRTKTEALIYQNFKIIHHYIFISYFSVEASFEEDVRRYLARKPMTTTEILRKMTQKRPNFPKEDIMPLLVNILKRINPHKQKIKGQMYLTIKTGNWLNLWCMFFNCQE